MNEDGVDDVVLGGVTTAGDGHLRRYFGGAAGALVGAQLDLLTEIGVSGEGLSALSVGDFDGDNHQDVVIAVSNSLVVGYGDGIVGFLETQVIPSTAEVTTLHAVDLDHEAGDELLVVENGGSVDAELRGYSLVDRQAATEVLSFAPEHRLGKVEHGDLNGDGVDDIAVDDSAFNGIVEVLMSNP